jgi:hypothetical protein
LTLRKEEDEDADDHRKEQKGYHVVLVLRGVQCGDWGERIRCVCQ